jgi:hypothetical protein
MGDDIDIGGKTTMHFSDQNTRAASLYKNLLRARFDRTGLRV